MRAGVARSTPRACRSSSRPWWASSRRRSSSTSSPRCSPRTCRKRHGPRSHPRRSRGAPPALATRQGAPDRLSLSDSGHPRPRLHCALSDPQGDAHEPLQPCAHQAAGVRLRGTRQLRAPAPRRDVLAELVEVVSVVVRIGELPVSRRLRGGAPAAPVLPRARPGAHHHPAAVDHPGGGGGADLGVHLPAQLRSAQRHPEPDRRDDRAGGVACEPGPGHARGDRHQHLAGDALLRDHAAGGAAGHSGRALRGRTGGWRLRLPALLLHHTADAQAHHRSRHRHPHRVDVQLRRSDLRHDQRRPGQRDPDPIDLYSASGLLEPRLRLCGDSIGGAAADHARVHGLLPADHPRARGRGVMRTPGRGLAERVLGGPVLWTGLGALTLFAMAPFVWVLLASFKTRAELYATPIVYLPTALSFANYVEAWTSRLTPFSRFFANSLWVSSVTMVATTVVSILAGYALARFRFAGRQTFLLVFLATQMFPAVLLIAPLLSQWYALGLIDTYQALIYSNFSFTVPFTAQPEMRTLSAGLLFMVGQYEIQWGQLSAGVIISTIPVAILFTYLQRHLIQGLSAGAVKG